MTIVLERECLALREEVRHLNEKQEVLATLMEGKMSMQKVALEKRGKNGQNTGSVTKMCFGKN